MVPLIGSIHSFYVISLWLLCHSSCPIMSCLTLSATLSRDRFTSTFKRKRNPIPCSSITELFVYSYKSHSSILLSLLSAHCHHGLLSSLLFLHSFLSYSTLQYSLLYLPSPISSLSSLSSLSSSPLFSPPFTKTNHFFLPESQPFTSDSDGKFAFIRQPNAMGVNVAVLGDPITITQPDYVCMHCTALL